MIRIINKNTGEICSETDSIQEAYAILETAPDELEINAEDVLQMYKDEATNEVMRSILACGNMLTSKYTLHEVLSWPVKVIEARNIINGEKDSETFPVIASECFVTGRSYLETAKTILAKNKPFAVASGAISGIRQEAIQQISDAKDEQEIQKALEWLKSEIYNTFHA